MVAHVMKKFLLLVFSIAFICLSGCKSAKKSLKRGDFDDSVLRAVEKLKNTPNHEGSIDILRAAYPKALEQHLDDIDRNRNSTDPFRWETELAAYKSLNKLFAAINGCTACSRITNPRNFLNDEQNAAERAVVVRYGEGQKALATGTMEAARVAYDHFDKANSLVPNYKDLDKKLTLALDIATFKVVVEQVTVTSRVYQLSNEYFQDRIIDFLQNGKNLNRFVRFYTPQEATRTKLTPHHVITLQFDDFVVGQTLIEKNTETLTSKDTVKVSEKVVGKIKVPIYGKVTAKFTKSRKTIHSSGILDMRIEDYASKRLAEQEKFAGEYNWMCEWASYNGDERALVPAQVRMCKSQELAPPAPQDLFIEFSKPIFDRLTFKLKNFYARF
jgi:hypothetical protein